MHHTYQVRIHGHLIEGRVGVWGGEWVLLDGRTVSERRFAWFTPSHCFQLTDEDGRRREVEVCWEKSRKLGLLLAMPPMVVRIDGEVRCAIPARGAPRLDPICYYCGYNLAGLQLVNGEVKCPECGRHTRDHELPPAALS